MEATIEGSPSFAYVHVDLDPGESIVAESDAMSSMAGDLDLKAEFNGGGRSGLAEEVLGRSGRGARGTLPGSRVASVPGKSTVRGASKVAQQNRSSRCRDFTGAPWKTSVSACARRWLRCTRFVGF